MTLKNSRIRLTDDTDAKLITLSAYFKEPKAQLIAKAVCYPEVWQAMLERYYADMRRSQNSKR